MEEINAIIAADDEALQDRDAFVTMIDGLNQVLAARDVQVKVCDYDPSRHAELLDESEIALVLYHTKCGAFGAKEVDDAYVRTVKKQNPKRLYIFFKDDDGCALEPEFVAFRNSFVERFEHFFCRFENVDTLKLNFIFSIENLLTKDGGEPFVKLDGSQVKVGDLDVGDFKRLPMVSNNEGLSGLFAQMDDLQKRFEAKKLEVESDPASEDAYSYLLDLSSQVNELQDKIDRELALSFGLAKRMSGVTIGESNEILSRAKSCMERGKIKEAIAILDGADTEGCRERLLRRRLEEVDEARSELKNYAALVDLELFRMAALMKCENLSADERKAMVEELRAVLLSELDKYKQNSSGALTAGIESLVSRVRTFISRAIFPARNMSM